MSFNRRPQGAFLTRKVGMMSAIDDQGAVVAVTLLQASPNYVSQVKTVDSDGYNAIQLAAEKGRTGKSRQGHLKKATLATDLKTSCELRLATAPEVKVGQEIALDTFQVGDEVEVTGRSKGKGFAGGIKRHNFARSPKSHGGKGYTRKPGSIGSTFPQRVTKGKRMAGRLGGQRTTIAGLRVGLVDTTERVIGVIGAVPGPRAGLVIIKKVVR